MFSDNGKFSDDLVGHVLGLLVRGAAIYQPIAYPHLQSHCFQPSPLTMTSSLMIWLSALWAKGCVVEIGKFYFNLG